MKALPYEARKQAVIEEITAAFDGVEREEGVSFQEAIVNEIYGNSELWAKNCAGFVETRWQDVPDALIGDSGFDVRNFHSPKRFRYFLPAFLMWYLRHVDSEELDSSDRLRVIDRLLTGGFEWIEGELKVDRFYLSLFAVLTPAQSQAVAHFLEFLVSRGQVRKAEQEAELQAEIDRGEVAESDAHYIRRKRSACRWDQGAQNSLDRYWGQFLDT